MLDRQVKLENVLFAFVMLLMFGVALVIGVVLPRHMVQEVNAQLDMEEVGMDLAVSVADMNFDAGQHALLQITTKDISIPEKLPDNWQGTVTSLSTESFFGETTMTPVKLEFLKKFLESYNRRIMCKLPKD